MLYVSRTFITFWRWRLRKSLSENKMKSNWSNGLLAPFSTRTAGYMYLGPDSQKGMVFFHFRFTWYFVCHWYSTYVLYMWLFVHLQHLVKRLHGCIYNLFSFSCNTTWQKDFAQHMVLKPVLPLTAINLSCPSYIYNTSEKKNMTKIKRDFITKDYATHSTRITWNELSRLGIS